jgi:hypothetical protein
MEGDRCGFEKSMEEDGYENNVYNFPVYILTKIDLGTDLHWEIKIMG